MSTHVETLSYPLIFPRRNAEAVKRIRRVLFETGDYDYNKEFLEKHTKLEFDRSCSKWNFDFEKESTLDPNGDYKWELVSQIKLHKKKRLSIAIDDNSKEYFQPIQAVADVPSDAVFEPIEPARSNRIKKDANASPKQSLITDFMVKKKRTVEVAKELPEVPQKKVKTGDLCLS